MSTTAFVTFDEDDDFDAEFPNTVQVDLDNGDSGFVRVHAHDGDACLDVFIPRERIKMLITRTEHDDFPKHSIN